MCDINSHKIGGLCLTYDVSFAPRVEGFTTMDATKFDLIVFQGRLQRPVNTTFPSPSDGAAISLPELYKTRLLVIIQPTFKLFLGAKGGPHHSLIVVALSFIVSITW